MRIDQNMEGKGYHTMTIIIGGLDQVPGYRFSALACGIRYEDRLDYALISADKPCNGAAVFTTNRLASPAVRINKERIENNIRAVMVNSTNANACTGTQGEANARDLSTHMAGILGISDDEILIASTGVIGVQLPVDKMKKSHEALASSLASEKGHSLSEAIMTTDTIPKECAATFDTSIGTFTIAGTAKGSGMIAPNMATMLSFFLTDAPVEREDLQAILQRQADATLNAITIDGDTSTNDTAILLAHDGEESLQGKDLDRFEEALGEVMMDLALKLVKDGEGVTTVVTVSVINASTSEDAEKIARTVGQSLLVKTAIFGRDPNWGRIAMAVGNSEAQVSEFTLSISFDDIAVLSKGTPQESDKNKLMMIMAQDSYTITVDIGQGTGSFTIFTGDISYDYVKINAEYTT
jgi:glutamate N-acetyltransferase / amino-acid N-acetyltransferase